MILNVGIFVLSVPVDLMQVKNDIHHVWLLHDIESTITKLKGDFLINGIEKFEIVWIKLSLTLKKLCLLLNCSWIILFCTFQQFK